jgi:hypothetical protein
MVARRELCVEFATGTRAAVGNELAIVGRQVQAPTLRGIDPHAPALDARELVRIRFGKVLLESHDLFFDTSRTSPNWTNVQVPRRLASAARVGCSSPIQLPTGGRFAIGSRRAEFERRQDPSNRRSNCSSLAWGSPTENTYENPHRRSCLEDVGLGRTSATLKTLARLRPRRLSRLTTSCAR